MKLEVGRIARAHGLRGEVVIDPITDHTIRVGQTLLLTAVGHDNDFPAQTLTFDLLSPPAGASITSR